MSRSVRFCALLLDVSQLDFNSIIILCIVIHL